MTGNIMEVLKHNISNAISEHMVIPNMILISPRDKVDLINELNDTNGLFIFPTDHRFKIYGMDVFESPDIEDGQYVVAYSPVM